MSELAVTALLGKKPAQANQEQASQASMFKPAAIYFDTNILVGAGWPTPSAQMLQIITQSEKIGFNLCLPEVVNQELEGHWIRDLIAEWGSTNGKIGHLNKKARSVVTFEKLPSLPSEDDLRIAVRKLASDFTQRFRIVPMAERALSEFVNLAIGRGATFQDEGKGFQDAVILCSVLDDMKANGFATAVIVAHDKDFKSAGATKFISAAGVELKVVSTLDDLEQLLRSHFNSIVREYFEHERKQLLDALNIRSQELEDYLVTNLTVNPSELSVAGNIKGIESLHVVSIEGAHTTFGLKKDERFKDSNEVKVSADVKVSLVLDIERYSLPEPQRLKVGGKAAPPPEPVPSLGSVFLNFQSKFYEAIAVVEADAMKIGTGYSDIRFTRAYLKQSGGAWSNLTKFLSDAK